jgi:hypothetical protein
MGPASKLFARYIYLRDQLDKGFLSYKIEDKINKELRSELETQGHLFKTMRAEMETFKGEKSSTGGGEKYFKMVCFHCGMLGLQKEGRNVVSGSIFPKLKPERKG